LIDLVLQADAEQAVGSFDLFGPGEMR